MCYCLSVGIRRCAVHCGQSEGRPSGPAWGWLSSWGENEHAGHIGDEIAGATTSQGSMWLIAKQMAQEHGGDWTWYVQVPHPSALLSPAGPAFCLSHPGVTPLMRLIQHRYSASRAKSFKLRSRPASRPPGPSTLEPKAAEMLKRTCHLVSEQPTSLPCPALSLL